MEFSPVERRRPKIPEAEAIITGYQETDIILTEGVIIVTNDINDVCNDTYDDNFDDNDVKNDRKTTLYKEIWEKIYQF